MRAHEGGGWLWLEFLRAIADLYLRDEVGQVEEVVTDPAHRGGALCPRSSCVPSSGHAEREPGWSS